MEPRLWRRKNGRWYVVYSDQGAQRQRSLRTDVERIAVRRFNEFVRKWRENKIEHIQPGFKKRLGVFVEEYLSHIEPLVEGTTYELYDTALQKALDAWGDVPVSHVTNRHLAALSSDMARAGLARPTINKNMRHLKAAFRMAEEWGYAPRVKFPKRLSERTEARYLTLDQLDAVMAEIDDEEFRDCCMLAAAMGLRSTEILRLRPSDVDNPRGYLRIDSHQKNKTEARVPMNAMGREILERCLARGGARLFRFNTRQTLSKKFKKAARAADVPAARFHDLRHTFGAALAMQGQGDALIQQTLRHKSRAATELYTRLYPEHLREAMEMVSDALKGAVRPRPRLVKKGEAK